MMNDEIIRFSQRMEQLPPYLFGMINRMKMKKRRQGDDVIDLGMGNPIDPAPEAVTHKLCEVARDPKSHRYPVADGLAHLRREIALNYQKEIVALAQKYRFMVIHDFAYAKIAFDGYKPPSFLQAPGARTVGVEFGFTGNGPGQNDGWRLYSRGRSIVAHHRWRRIP